jgi:hypothetical protein
MLSTSWAPLPAVCRGSRTELHSGGQKTWQQAFLLAKGPPPDQHTYFSMSLFLHVFCMASCLLLSPLLVDGISVETEGQLTLWARLGSTGDGSPLSRDAFFPQLLLIWVRTYHHWPI